MDGIGCSVYVVFYLVGAALTYNIGGHRYGTNAE